MRTQVAIIGGGPAGMFLAHLLARAGIEAVVLERRSRDYVEGRVRAGVLDRITVDVMGRLGLDARLRREGLAACRHDADVRRRDLPHRLRGADGIAVSRCTASPR